MQRNSILRSSHWRKRYPSRPDKDTSHRQHGRSGEFQGTADILGNEQLPELFHPKTRITECPNTWPVQERIWLLLGIWTSWSLHEGQGQNLGNHQPTVLRQQEAADPPGRFTHSAFHFISYILIMRYIFHITVVAPIIHSITVIGIAESFCSHVTVMYRMAVCWKRVCKCFQCSPISVNKELSWRSRQCGWHHYKHLHDEVSLASVAPSTAASRDIVGTSTDAHRRWFFVLW